jgi:hypothetical protein
MDLINTLKYYGRGVLLPVSKIKKTVKEVINQKRITAITDFGAGTLLWSNWFSYEFDIKISAVDTLYNAFHPENNDDNIAFFTDINAVIDMDAEARNGKIAIFICDVIHHLPSDFWLSLMARICLIYDVIIIKDIDATHKFGNFCNRIHDLIVNNEKVQNVYPDAIEDWLKTSGYSINRQFIPKLWYPHFLIVGVKNSD